MAWLPLSEKLDNMPGYMLNESSQLDTNFSYKSIQGKPDKFSGNHIHLFPNSFHKTKTFMMV